MDGETTDTRFTVRGEYITLGQLLKMVGIVGTGGESKHYLAERSVLVNGEPEQRRGRKLRPGDRLEVSGESAILLCAPAE